MRELTWLFLVIRFHVDRVIGPDNAEVAGSIPASPTTIFVHVRGNFLVFPPTGSGAPGGCPSRVHRARRVRFGFRRSRCRAFDRRGATEKVVPEQLRCSPVSRSRRLGVEIQSCGRPAVADRVCAVFTSTARACRVPLQNRCPESGRGSLLWSCEERLRSTPSNPNFPGARSILVSRISDGLIEAGGRPDRSGLRRASVVLVNQARRVRKLDPGRYATSSYSWMSPPSRSWR